MSESKELTVPERAAVALGTAEHEKTLIELSKKYSDITKIVNPAGREQCHSAYMELKNTRVAIATAGKAAREDANAFQKAVIAEVDRLTAITAAEEGRLQALRDAYDAEREAERLAKAAADRARVNSIRAKIDEIKDCLVVGMGRSSGELASAISELETTEITLEEYGDFAGEAQAAQAATVVKLKEMLTAQVDHEASQARLAAEREALERQRAELAAQERLAAAARAEQEARDRAERERVEAEQRAAQERAAEAMRQQQAEHEARMRVQQEEIDRQQAELAAERQRQADEAARAEQEKQAAIAAEAERVAAEEQRKREEAEAAARAEAERIQAGKAAAEAERQRRERVEFIRNGPGDVELVLSLAAHWVVSVGDAMSWLKQFDYEAADEQFATMNASGGLPHLEKAA
jgi:hypothetical protein